jgi:hypothetical protein
MSDQTSSWWRFDAMIVLIYHAAGISGLSPLVVYVSSQI